MYIKDVIVWGTECTLDVMLKLEESQFNDMLSIFMGQGINGKYKVLFERLSEKGLKRDEEVKGIDQEILMDLIRNSYEIIKEGSNQRRESIGDSPCISAYTSRTLADGHPSFPDIHYVGSLPSTVQSYVQIVGNGHQEFFAHSIKNDHCPLTFSIEVGRYKLMLANSKGRNLDELDREQYIKSISELMNDYQGNRVIAFGGLNKGSPSDYHKLFSHIRKNVSNVKLFLGTNSFSSQDEQRIKEVYGLLETADIISFNDAELTDVSRAVLNNGGESLSERLRNTLPSKFKICHSAEGAIMSLNDEGKQMNGDCDFNKILQICSDAASYCYWSGHKPTHIEAIIYSDSVKQRQEERFHNAFVSPNSGLPKGMLRSIAPDIKDARGTLTGIGATFDGYLMSCLLSKNLF